MFMFLLGLFFFFGGAAVDFFFFFVTTAFDTFLFLDATVVFCGAGIVLVLLKLDFFFLLKESKERATAMQIFNDHPFLLVVIQSLVAALLLAFYNRFTGLPAGEDPKGTSAFKRTFWRTVVISTVVGTTLLLFKNSSPETLTESFYD